MKINEIINEVANQPKGVAEGLEQQYLWHGSRQKIPMLEPRQSVDTGGAVGSNQNAIYATSDPKVAIAMGLTTPGSDTGMFPNDPQMVLFSGKIRKGENVYLHKVPMNGTDGKPQFVQGGNSREFHSVPGVKGIKPTEIKAVPVDKYLNLIRQATPQDLELRKKYMKQGVAEDTGSWIVYDPKTRQICKRFKTHTAGKSYAKVHGLGFASSEYYFDRVKGQEVVEAQTDYQKRRQRERDVDAGKPVKPLPKNPQTDYAKKRAKEKRDLELFGESTNYWTRLQTERNKTSARLIAELQETIKDIK